MLRRGSRRPTLCTTRLLSISHHHCAHNKRGIIPNRAPSARELPPIALLGVCAAETSVCAFCTFSACTRRAVESYSCPRNEFLSGTCGVGVVGGGVAEDSARRHCMRLIVRGRRTRESAIREDIIDIVGGRGDVVQLGCGGGVEALMTMWGSTKIGSRSARGSTRSPSGRINQRRCTVKTDLEVRECGEC